MGYVDHFIRRGVEHPTMVNMFKRAVEEGPKLEIPTWGVVLFVTTFIVFTVCLSSLEYTLKDVVATIAMVETPSAAITVSPSEEPSFRDIKEEHVETGPTITLVHQKPITSSIRGTIRHLVSQAGCLARWRGIRSYALYHVCYSFVCVFFTNLIPAFLPGRLVLISAISGALTANLHASWTHKVISMPSQQSFFSRIPARSSWKQLALPAAVKSSASLVAIYISQGAIVLLGLDRLGQEDFSRYSGSQWTSVSLRFLSVFAIAMITSLFIVLPAVVTQIRVEASMLPEEEDTIVPFDRTFAGKVVPKILGGTGAIGFLDAWRSFNWEARRRLVKLFIKFSAIFAVVVLIMAQVLVFEVWAFMGPAIGKYLAQARQQGFPQ